MMFDAATLARGWLSVALASGRDKERPVLDRTVHIEHHPQGLRLVATDSRVLLHCFVPSAQAAADLDPPPELDESPIATATARDPWGRGRGFLAHVLRLATAEDAEPIDVRVRLNVPGEARQQGQFEGMEATTVVLEHPDVERLVLDVVEGGFPSWGPIFAGGRAVSTDRVAQSPENVGRHAKVEKWLPSSRLGWTFGGELAPARVDVIDSDPWIDGIVMPARWDFDLNAPRVDDTPDHDDQTEDDDALQEA
jgi:hypothetical protein